MALWYWYSSLHFRCFAYFFLLCWYSVKISSPDSVTATERKGKDDEKFCRIKISVKIFSYRLKILFFAAHVNIKLCAQQLLYTGENETLEIHTHKYLLWAHESKFLWKIFYEFIFFYQHIMKSFVTFFRLKVSWYLYILF